MSGVPGPGDQGFTEAWRRREHVVDQFEDAWRRGQRPRLENYLPADPAERRAVLVELVRAELECRTRAGEAVLLESYLERYPELAACADYPELLDEVTLRLEGLRVPAPGTSTSDYKGAESSVQEPGEEQRGQDVSLGTQWEATGAHRYQPQRFHAKGGLGEVFLAHDAQLHRDVALKRIQKPRARDPESQRRFLLEAEITARLEHPGVVPVHSLVQDESGQPCYAMRFIQGESLRDAIHKFHEADKTKRDPGERSLALRQMLNQFNAVCKTIAYAHSRGIIHRDIKPGNIMLGKYGETLVVDWGLAKFRGRPEEQKDQGEPSLRPLLGSGGESTQEGLAVGTPAYMSPEQATGDWETVGPESDIYSLGATLYSILTGRAPFPPGDPRDKVKRGEFPTPRSVNKTVPRALEAICLKAMSLWPQDRYRSALDLGGDVEHWLADEPVGCFHEPLAVRCARWLRRQRVVAAAIGTLFFAGVVFLVFYAIYARFSESRISHEKDIADEQREKAESLISLTRDSLNQVSSNVVEMLLAKKKQLEPEDRRLLEDTIRLNEKLVASSGERMMPRR
jgi:serine/threonine protein kinase